jgi:subtilisin family serine protease
LRSDNRLLIVLDSVPRSYLSIAAAALGLLLAAPAAPALEDAPAPAAAPATPPTVLSPNRVIVQWAAGADRHDKARARAEAEVEFKGDLGNRDFQLVKANPGQTPAGAIAELEADPAVALAERDGYRSLHAIPNDPLFDQLWGLRNLGLGVGGFSGAVAGDDIDAAAAWDHTVGSASIVVADIDSGYRFEHPDLAAVAWTNPGEGGTANGLDDDGNSIVDDLHGADFVGANGESPTVDGNPTDEDLLSGGHGVHTAGTMGAAGDNGIGITGVAQDVRIMPLRACSRFPSAAANRCPFSSIVSAINYAGAKGARAANMSLGGNTFTQAEVNAIAANPGVLYVISAGNDGSDNDAAAAAPHGHHYPCDYRPPADASPPVPGAIDNIVCVAATDQADGLAGFSDWGATSVDIGAPGTETLSTYPYSTPFEDSFSVDDFAAKWPETGANGGFERTNESPLASFGMTDIVGAPTANTVRETTSAPFAVAANGGCKLNQTRRVVLAGTEHYRYSVLLNGIEQVASEPPSTTEPGLDRRFLELPPAFNSGGSVQIRFRFTAGAAPAASSGVWLDDVSIVCSQAVGQASDYGYLEGTSMAAPHVTGAAALLFSSQPSATVTEVRDALLSSVDPVASLSGKTTTGGRLDVARAIDALNQPTPPTPLLTATDPASPANENHPKIVGSAAAGTVVDIYPDSSCEGAAVASGSAGELESPGIAVSVADNSVSEFSARATDSVPSTSSCSAPIAYTETSPAAPLLTSTSPPSPATDGSPRILGSAEAGSSVDIYRGSSCGGIPAASGTAAELKSPGITVSVAAGSSAEFVATATDAADNTSPCSAAIPYTNSTIAIVIGPVVVTTDPLLESLPSGVTPGATIPAPPVFPGCKVPKLSGKTLAQAKVALSGVGCRVGKVSKPRARKGRGALVVKSSSPGPGAMAAGSVVGLALGPKPKKHHH